MNRIDSKFAELKSAGKTALITYIMGADPDIPATELIIEELERSGADIIELGVPFTDPLADGPVIETAAGRALKNRPGTAGIFSMVSRVRKKTEIPIVLMLYYNLIFKYGEERFVKEAVSAGVDGIIVPDLPPEEGGSLIRLSRENSLATIFLIAPTSPPERVELISRVSTGFIYYVALIGITGADIDNISQIGENIKNIKKISSMPVAVGFGVKKPEDAAILSASADGVIVGTAIVSQIENYQANETLARLGSYVSRLSESIKK